MKNFQPRFLVSAACGISSSNTRVPHVAAATLYRTKSKTFPGSLWQLCHTVKSACDRNFYPRVALLCTLWKRLSRLHLRCASFIPGAHRSSQLASAPPARGGGGDGGAGQGCDDMIMRWHLTGAEAEGGCRADDGQIESECLYCHCTRYNEIKKVQPLPISFAHHHNIQKQNHIINRIE